MKVQHQDYDKIFKENISKVIGSVLAKVASLYIRDIKDLPSSLPRTLVRYADLIKLATDVRTGEEFIMHIEFQVKNHKKMDWRMLVYRALLSSKYGLPVRQFVIYLGNGACTMIDNIEEVNMSFKYDLVVFNTFDYRLFLDSEEPEEIILAILANHKNDDKSDIIEKLLQRLIEMSKSSENLQKNIMELEILAHLRNLQPKVIQKIQAMPITYDIKTDGRFLQGIEQGIEQGQRIELENTIVRCFKEQVAIPTIVIISATTEAEVLEILKKHGCIK